MALILNEEIKVNSVQDALEKAGMFFYRLEKLANSSIVINEFKDDKFKNAAYKQDCLFYQLEAIRDLAQQCEDLFDELAVTFGRSIDLKFKELDRIEPGTAELLPEDSAQAVLAGGAGITRPRQRDRAVKG